MTANNETVKVGSEKYFKELVPIGSNNRLPRVASTSPSIARHNAGPRRLVVRATLGAEGGERWRFETAGA
jgi:hypothetical protein